MNFSTVLNHRHLEYFDDGHVYLCDGIEIPSITQMLADEFGHRFDGIDSEVLRRAAEKGTQVHEAIEDYCRTGREADLPEVRGWKELQEKHGFEVVGNELPVILSWRHEVIAAGRLDLLLREDDVLGIGDIKRVSKLDTDYLTRQLNLYRIAYMQTYGQNIDFLRGVHLRESVKRYVDIPVEGEKTYNFINKWVKEHKHE